MHPEIPRDDLGPAQESDFVVPALEAEERFQLMKCICSFA